MTENVEKETIHSAAKKIHSQAKTALSTRKVKEKSTNDSGIIVLFHHYLKQTPWHRKGIKNKALSIIALNENCKIAFLSVSNFFKMFSTVAEASVCTSKKTQHRFPSPYLISIPLIN